MDNYQNTDTGNARRFLKMHKDNVRYCPPWRHWLIWNGKCWESDNSGRIYELARETVNQMWLDAEEISASSKKKDIKEIADALKRWAKQSEALGRLRNMVELASTFQDVVVFPDDLDSDPNLLCVKNGTLNLRTSTIRKHQREDLITQMIGQEYCASAPCATWDKFVSDVMAGDMEMVEYLQTVIGYALTGHTSEQVMFILYGQGSNGKGTFMEVIVDLLTNGLARSIDPSTIMERRSDAHSNDIARLKGCRLASCSETDQAAPRLSEGVVKRLTGGDTITARHLYQENFEFRPTFKIFLQTNPLPEIRGGGYSIWRRLRPIHFSVKFDEAKADKKLPLKLREELEGILRWAVNGAENWYKNGLTTPAKVLESLDIYKAENDEIGEFIKENIDPMPGINTPFKRIKQRYKEWCEHNAKEKLSDTKLGIALGAAGLEKGTSNGVYYRNVTLTDVDYELEGWKGQGEDNFEPFQENFS